MMDLRTGQWISLVARQPDAIITNQALHDLGSAEAVQHTYQEVFSALPVAGLFINAARTMLTGQAVGPSMFEVFEILGGERSVNRLRSGVPWFDAMEELGDV